MAEIVVRQATVQDLPQVVAVHEKAFPGFFMTRMGAGFLSAYYRLVLDYPGGILMVTASADGIEGFVAGFLDPAQFYAYMAVMKRRLFRATLVALLRRPSLLPRVLHNRRRVEARGVAADLNLCELSSIAVAPGAAGCGYGAKLVEAFNLEARRRGSRRVILSTDADENEEVNAFYVRCGFSLERTILSGRSRRMNIYAQQFNTGVDRSDD